MRRHRNQVYFLLAAQWGKGKLENSSEFIVSALQGFAADIGHGDSCFGDDLVISIAAAIEQATVSETERRAVYPESGGNLMHMMIVRHQRRTAKSIRIKNFQTDTSMAINVASSAMLGLPGIIFAASGASFSPFSVLAMATGLAFAVWRAFEKPVRWEDACLLHALNMEANFHGVVPKDLAEKLGATLESNYGYKKALNSNEVVDILDRLVAWQALDQIPEGFRVTESVKFWRGPWKSE